MPADSPPSNPADRGRSIIQTPYRIFLRFLANFGFMSSRNCTPESESYGWIGGLLFFLQLNIACRLATSSGCVPQGQLRSTTGTKAPDFTFYICCTDFPNSVPSILGGWWEAKKFASKLIIMAVENRLAEYFTNTFLSSYHQLYDQAVTAFAANPYVKVFRSFFSCGAHFALIEWSRTPDDRLPPDPNCTWMTPLEERQRQVIAKGSQMLLDQSPEYSKIRLWMNAHPVDAPDLDDAVRRSRQQVFDLLKECELIRSGVTLPRIYFFNECILCGDVAPLERMHEELRWDTVRDISRQFLKAIDLVNNSPSIPALHRSTAPPGSHFAPPTDPATFTPQEANLTLLCDTLSSLHQSLFSEAFDRLLDLDVLDQSLVSNASLHSEYLPEAGSSTGNRQPEQPDPPAGPSSLASQTRRQPDQPPPLAKQSRQAKQKRQAPPSINYRDVYETRAWTKAHPQQG